MLNTFRQKNIFAPGARVLWLSLLCWVMFEIGFALILVEFFDITEPAGLYWFQIANFCASFILTAVCFLPFLKKSVSDTDFRGFGRSLFQGYGLYMALSFAVSVIIMALDSLYAEPSANANQELVEQLLNQKSLPMIVCTVFLAPVTEECLVRGVLFAPLCRYKPWLAYLVSVVVFSVLHMVASIETVIATGSFDAAAAVGLLETFLTYLPSGIMLGWIYQRTGTIVGPIALHALSNLIAVVTILWAY